MKKYGKYEKMPDGSRAKQPPVKSMLLQTYFTSLICLLLCVSMFFGTSYAWFTSEVKNPVNEIYIGTLDVGLYKEVSGQDPVDLSQTGEPAQKLFAGNIRWEPGYTSLETIQVTNEGDLAFKYTLDFTDGIGKDRAAVGLTPEQLAALAANFDVWVFNHQDQRYPYQQPDAYTGITETSGWVNVGTLDKVLGDGVVLKDMMMEVVRQDDQEDDATTPNETPDGVKTAHRYTIALHMNEGVTSEVMGYKIELNVKLIAYQMGSENDGFGSPAYDDATFVTNAQELQAALDNATDNTVIRFANDITGDATINQNVNAKLEIDGNGKTMNGTINIDAQSDTTSSGSITIKNINFKTADTERNFIYSVENNHYPLNVTVSGCSFEGPDASSDVVGIQIKSAKNLVIENCTATKVHSILQNNSGWNLTIKDVTVTEAGRGMSLGTVQGVTITGVNADVTKYGVRIDATYDTAAVFTDCNIKANIPVVVRNVSAAYSLTFKGTNTMTQTNTEGIWCAIGTNEYGDVNKDGLTAPTGTVNVTLEDTGLNAAGIYTGEK